jgi:hypothetical protein
MNINGGDFNIKRYHTLRQVVIDRLGVWLVVGVYHRMLVVNILNGVMSGRYDAYTSYSSIRELMPTVKRILTLLTTTDIL